jgi:hypothetical protein
MKKSIILVSALSVVVMALVSCASDSGVDPFRVRTDTTTPDATRQEPAPSAPITHQWNVTHNLPPGEICTPVLSVGVTRRPPVLCDI